MKRCNMQDGDVKFTIYDSVMLFSCKLGRPPLLDLNGRIPQPSLWDTSVWWEHS